MPDRFARMHEDRSVQSEVVPTIDQREAVGLFPQPCPLLLAVLLLSSIGQPIGEMQQVVWRVVTELLGISRRPENCEINMSNPASCAEGLLAAETALDISHRPLPFAILLGTGCGPHPPERLWPIARLRDWRRGPTILRMKMRWVPLLACLVMPLLAACDADPADPAGPVTATSVTYSCCEARDVDRPYQPGQTLTVHWAVESPDEPGGTPPQVELTARLTGPFAAVGDLKAATEGTPTVPGLVTFAAAPVRPSGTPDERPISTIVIAADAKPGYYNLVTAVVGGDNTASGGGSVVRVVPRP
ncbi:hypothetical protein ACLQ29_32135 [Micromonospora sp. DT228]|uniref:hypothetical protein n=1 Tax=Micromonospora sp. DT228 TaxID=3393443 RepID=UPI003CF07AF0